MNKDINNDSEVPKITSLLSAIKSEINEQERLLHTVKSKLNNLYFVKEMTLTVNDEEEKIENYSAFDKLEEIHKKIMENTLTISRIVGHLHIII